MIDFFLETVLMSCRSSKITSKIEEYSVPFPYISPVFSLS